MEDARERLERRQAPRYEEGLGVGTRADGRPPVRGRRRKESARPDRTGERRIAREEEAAFGRGGPHQLEVFHAVKVGRIVTGGSKPAREAPQHGIAEEPGGGHV